jgi:hypothetical protein
LLACPLVRLALVVFAVAVGGCGAADPFAGAPRPLAVVALPGHAAATRAPIARTRGSTLIAFADGDGLYARLFADDGRVLDRALGPATLVAVAGLDEGFAVAVRVPGGIAVHFLDAWGAADRLRTVALAGTPIDALASDGKRVILAATTGGEIAIDTPRPLNATLAIVAPDTEPMTIELGQVPAPPSLWGDHAGFVVAGAQLLDGSGAMAAAPGVQLATARLFRRPVTAGARADVISRDGQRWLGLDGLATRAATDGRETLLQLAARQAEGGELLWVRQDLTLRARLPAPSTGSLQATNGDLLIWSRDESDTAFAGLDAATAAPRGQWIEILGAARGSISMALGASDVVFAWNDSSVAEPGVKMARVIP